MKRLVKWTMILSAVFCLLGIGIITAGAVMDGGRHLGKALRVADRWDGWYEDWEDWEDRWEDRWENEKFPDDPERAAVSKAEGSDKAAVPKAEDPGKASASAAEESVLYENIRELEAEVAGIVSFQESDELGSGQMMIIKSQDGEDYEYFQEGGTLKIRSPRSRQRSSNASRNTIVIRVPARSNLQEIDIEVTAGEFLAGIMRSKELSLQAKAGVIEVKQSECDKLELEADAGYIVCRSDVSKEVSADSDLGSIELFLKGKKEDFNYELECSAGSIALEGSQYQGLHQKEKIDYAAKKKAELECSAGSIVVNYYEETE